MDIAGPIDGPVKDGVDAPTRTLAGDWTDDDGQAIDDQFEAAYSGPVTSESVAIKRENLPAATRMLSRSINVGAGSVPVQVFPADLNRKQLTVQADGFVRIGSDKSDTYNGADLNPANLWESVCHTGALWVHSEDEETVTVTVWSVTV